MGDKFTYERDVCLNLIGDKGQSQNWRIIDYTVVKCHSHFLVSQSSSGQGESEAEEDVIKEEIR